MSVRRASGRLGGMLGVLARHLLPDLLERRARRWPEPVRRVAFWTLRRWQPSEGWPVAESEPERLKNILEDLGGTFVKLGQMLALQPDILPITYCNALFDLLDRVQPVPYPELAKVFEEELDEPPEALFETFERQPLGSASIGQVHIATLAGRKLAVKIQRPGAAEGFRGDLRLIRRTLTLIRWLRLRRFDWLLEPLAEFVSWTEEELDYRHEARYLEAMRRQQSDARDTGLRQKVPALVSRLTRRRVLVVELLEGPSLLDYLRAKSTDRPLPEATLAKLRALQQQGFDPHRLARNLIDNFLDQVFLHGLFHADLHPANLLILPGHRIGYIDFGITGALSGTSRRHLVAMTLATASGDLEGMAQAMLEVSQTDQADLPAFRSGLQRLARSWFGDPATHPGLRCSFTQVMLDMLQLSRSTGVWPERDVIKYIRSSMAIDGLIQRLAPDLDLGAYLATACSRHLRWYALEQQANPEALLAWSGASLRLLRDGALRAGALLGRLVETRLAAVGEPPAGWPAGATAPTDPGRGPGADHGPLPSGRVTPWLVVGLIALLAFTPPTELGLNLFTSQLLLVAFGLVQLSTGRRPA